MLNYWWLYFGFIFISIVTSVGSFHLLRYRYSVTLKSDLSWFEKVSLHYGLDRQLLFSTPAWIENDRVNRRLHRAFRVSTAFYLVGIVGFPIVTLLLSK